MDFSGNATKTSLGAEFKTSLGGEMIYIPAGKFRMGSPATESGRTDTETQVDVEITKGLYLGKYEVTQGEWKSLMGTEPWKDRKKLRGAYVREGAEYPAVYIAHGVGAYGQIEPDTATDFCKKLSAKEGKQYRLPTEAEWEYACCGGELTAYSFGDDASKLVDYAWFGKNTWDANDTCAHKVGLKRPNPFGLYDMHGNVYEWCSDWYGDKLAGGQDPLGPAIAEKDSFRVSRGGDWGCLAKFCRSAWRNGHTPDLRVSCLGFRLALVPASQEAESPEISSGGR